MFFAKWKFTIITYEHRYAPRMVGLQFEISLYRTFIFQSLKKLLSSQISTKSLPSLVIWYKNSPLLHLAKWILSWDDFDWQWKLTPHFKISVIDYAFGILIMIQAPKTLKYHELLTKYRNDWRLAKNLWKFTMYLLT